MAIAFDGVSVVPMDSEQVVENQTVVVEGDRITQVGPVDRVRCPVGAERIDGRGRYLMPGLADMHAHPVAPADLLLFLAHGVTTVRNLWGMPRHLAWRDRIASGEMLGPSIHTTGPIVDGRPVRTPWTTSVETEDEAQRAVVATKRPGYEALKVYDQLTPETYGWLVAAANAHDLPTVGHVPFRVGLDGVLAARQRSIEHLYGYVAALQPAAPREQVPPATAAEMRTALLRGAQDADEERLPELAEATRAAGTWNCPTLLLRRRWLEDREELVARPELRYLSPARAEQYRRFLAGYPAGPGREELWALNRRITKALSDAGAGLLLGTDAGIPMVLPGASIHEELAAFVEAGLTPYQALRAGTADAARFLGLEEEWGTVAPGRRADLLLVEDDPLRDVGNASRIAGVLVRGYWLSAAVLSARLEELAAGDARSTPPARPSSRHRADRASTIDVHKYQVEWCGRLVGEEQVSVEHAADGGRLLLFTADLEVFGSPHLFGVEAGSYRAAVEVDRHGTDQRAWFEHVGRDGEHRIDLIREGDTLRARYRGPFDGDGEQRDGISAGAVLGIPLVGLYHRVAERLGGLAVGERREVPVVGPGLPPDLSVAASTVQVEAVPPDAGDAGWARFTFRYTRGNAHHSGSLTCDGAGIPVELELAGALPILVRRVPTSSSTSSSARAVAW